MALTRFRAIPMWTIRAILSFHSQISSVFKVPGKKDLYIACADRWLPKLMDLKYEEYRENL